VYKAAILAAHPDRAEPDYTHVTARLLLHTIAQEVLGEGVGLPQWPAPTPGLPRFIQRGVEHELLDERLLQFDLARLGAALKPERDLQFDYLGLQTLYDRYFLHVRKQRIELPQAFFMRVAMGLALNEIDREARAIEFYEVLSSFDFMSSTPTLFNSGTLRSQLSSCYLTTVPDDLDGIYESIKENALLSKFAGGLGNDWTRCARWAPHQGHQRRVARRGAVPEGGQRHGRGGQPGRQAQGRRLRLPGDLAPGHRGVPGAAQEHRRRPPPHARHEHRQLDSRPVHEAA
jgi:ribonucleoside-diphosphate reductase alpha chain